MMANSGRNIWFLSSSNENQLDIHCCIIDLITLPINYYTQRGWHISELQYWFILIRYFSVTRPLLLSDCCLCSGF